MELGSFLCLVLLRGVVSTGVSASIVLVWVRFLLPGLDAGDDIDGADSVLCVGTDVLQRIRAFRNSGFKPALLYYGVQTAQASGFSQHRAG